MENSKKVKEAAKEVLDQLRCLDPHEIKESLGLGMKKSAKTLAQKWHLSISAENSIPISPKQVDDYNAELVCLLFEALRDILDGTKEHDLPAMTGVSVDRSSEIFKLYNILNAQVIVGSCFSNASKEQILSRKR